MSEKSPGAIVAYRRRVRQSAEARRWTAGPERPGLNALAKAAQQRRFDTVLVDDLSRLARDNLLMLSTIASFQYEGVRIISVADGLSSDNEDAKLGIQIRGIFNELHLRDLSKKTLRGQLGQKRRGYSIGGTSFGYRTVPAGQMIRKPDGQMRPEGWKPEIDEAEAGVVRRVFELYAAGQAATRIARTLNQEGVCGRHRSHQRRVCWRAATIGYMLDNEKYAGRWIWNKRGTRKDPKTGRKRAFVKPQSEWVVHNDESLRIIPADLWEKAQARRALCSKVWKKGQGAGFRPKQGSHSSHHAVHPLSGLLVCSECNSCLAQVSGKSSGYLGCPKARRCACDNRVLVKRALVEQIVFDRLTSLLAAPERMEALLAKVKTEVSALAASAPQQLREKNAELARRQAQLDNFVAFVAAGNHSPAVCEALAAAEARVKQLKGEIADLQAASRPLKFPSADWVASRLHNLREMLAARSSATTRTLKQFLGSIVMQPTYPQRGRPWYTAQVSFPDAAAMQMLACCNQLGGAGKGSTTFESWARLGSNQ